MRNSTRNTILFALFAFLVCSAFAGTTNKDANADSSKQAKPADTKPVDTKPIETKPVETKPVDAKSADAKPVDTKPKPVESKPAEPKKAETKPESKPAAETKAKKAAPKAATETKSKDGSAFDDLQAQAAEYIKLAKEVAEKYLAEAKVLYTQYAKAAHDNAERLVDKYLSSKNAKYLKDNFFNFYGFLAVTLLFFTLSFLASKIDWVFSLNPIRAFLSSFGFGIFLTLYGLTHLVKDPAISISNSAPGAIENFQTVALAWFTILFALNLAAVFKGGFRNFLQLFVSHLLFVDYLGFRHHIEGHTGLLPPYTLPLLAFFVLTLLSFAQLEAAANPPTVYNVGYKEKKAHKVPTQDSSPAVTPIKEGKKKSKKN